MKDEKKDVNLYVLEVVAEGTDSEGNFQQQLAWRKMDRDVNLGSVVKPNSKIKGFKYMEEPETIFDVFRK